MDTYGFCESERACSSPSKFLITLPDGTKIETCGVHLTHTLNYRLFNGEKATVELV